jgi:predicted molibdopterin-dependent oxidoreductase YjgC
MVVQTETPAVNQVRRTAVELLIADHPSDCLACAKNQRCELQKVAAYLGITRHPFQKTTKMLPVDTSNPFFNRDLNYCILCGKCVRACNEIRGVGAIDLAFRGYDTRVATCGDGPIIDSNCESCGACVDICPVAALMPKDTTQPIKEVQTTCPYCGVGCQMYLGIRQGKVVAVRGKKEGTLNRDSLCVKGRFGITEFVHHAERLTVPLVKRDGKLTETTWDEALDTVARKLSSYRADEVAVISSAKATNEDNYVIQKFARAVLGTNNIDHCARL